MSLQKFRLWQKKVVPAMIQVAILGEFQQIWCRFEGNVQ